MSGRQHGVAWLGFGPIPCVLLHCKTEATCSLWLSLVRDYIGKITSPSKLDAAL